MPNYSLITVLFSTPLIFRYYLPLNHDTTKVWNGLVNKYKLKNKNLETLFNPLFPPKKCLILNNFLLNVQDSSMRFIES